MGQLPSFGTLTPDLCIAGSYDLRFASPQRSQCELVPSVIVCAITEDPDGDNDDDKVNSELGKRLLQPLSPGLMRARGKGGRVPFRHINELGIQNRQEPFDIGRVESLAKLGLDRSDWVFRIRCSGTGGMCISCGHATIVSRVLSL